MVYYDFNMQNVSHPTSPTSSRKIYAQVPHPNIYITFNVTCIMRSGRKFILFIFPKAILTHFKKKILSFIVNSQRIYELKIK